MKALQRLKEPYEEAGSALVIESYLSRHSGSGVSPFELLARIASCSWSPRLWTFQEGRLPTEPARVWFAFRNRSVDLLHELNVPYSHFPTLASHTVHLGLLFGHKQTQMIGSPGIGFTGNQYFIILEGGPDLGDALAYTKSETDIDEQGS